MSPVLKSSLLFIVFTSVAYWFMAVGAVTQIEDGHFVPEDTSLVYWLLTFLGAMGGFVLLLWKFNRWLMKEYIRSKDEQLDEKDIIIEQLKDTIHDLSEKPKKRRRK